MRELHSLSCVPMAMEESRLRTYFEQLPMHIARGIPSAAELEAREAATAAKLKAVRGKVVVLPLVGVIEQRMSLMSYYFGGVSTEVLGMVLDDLMGRKEVDAVVLDWDSPGGTIDGVEEATDKVFNLRATKPIYSISNSSMYSAAYWIGTAASKTFVTNGGGVGSVGVYTMHTDWTKALEADGINVQFIRKPENKADVNPYEPLSESAREHLEQVVGESYTKFVAAVARNRGINPKAVQEKYGNGRIVLAKQALAAGMVDGIKTRDQLLAELQGTAGQSGGSRSRASVNVLRLREEQRKRTTKA